MALYSQNLSLKLHSLLQYKVKPFAFDPPCCPVGVSVGRSYCRNLVIILWSNRHLIRLKHSQHLRQRGSDAGREAD